jgi:CBS domain containing-hemolysin-like protein
LFCVLLALAGGFCALAQTALTRPRRRGEDRSPEEAETLGLALELWKLLLRFAAAGLLARFIPPARFFPALCLGALGFIAAEVLGRALGAGIPPGPLLSPLSVLALPWRPLCVLVSRRLRRAGEEAFRASMENALEEGEKNGVMERRERSMVEGVLYLGDRPVSAFMTHRSEIEWLDIGAGPGEAREKALARRAQGFFPVIRDTQDNIAGVVSVEDILAALTGGEGWKGLASFMKKPRFIPETLSALKAIETFNRAFSREEDCFLCVMDEYGGFAGSLRLRDLIEEIVGELGSAASEDPVIAQKDGTWLADGSVSLDELAEVPGLEALGEPPPQKGDYHTLAGFILKLAGEIPKTGESFTWESRINEDSRIRKESFRFQVLDLDGNRIDKVLIGKDP